MSKVAEKLIALKEIGEIQGLYQVSVLVEFGANKPQRKADTARRMRQLVLKHENVKMAHRKIKCGFAPI